MCKHIIFVLDPLSEAGIVFLGVSTVVHTVVIGGLMNGPKNYLFKFSTMVQRNPFNKQTKGEVHFPDDNTT